MTLDLTKVRTKAAWLEAPDYETNACIADALAAVEGLLGRPLGTNEEEGAERLLAATEIAAGELTALRWRMEGARETLAIGDLRLTPPDLDFRDPYGLIAAGIRRIGHQERPYSEVRA